MASSKVLFHRNPQFSRCPECKTAGSLHRSRSKNLYEQILRRITFLKTYRCKECGWRGFRSTVVVTRKSIRSIVIYLIIILVTAFLARYLILNYVLT